MNPFRLFFDRCRLGFTVWQKVLITTMFLAYVGSPVQLIPNSIPGFGLLDDAFCFFCIGRVWASPLVRRGARGATSSAPAEPGARPSQPGSAAPEVSA
jgi:uncharacterized membrane protein YkvA (DUF1232 family)